MITFDLSPTDCDQRFKDFELVGDRNIAQVFKTSASA